MSQAASTPDPIEAPVELDPPGEDQAAFDDDLDALLDALPPEIRDRLRTLPDLDSVIEVVMDLGRRPEARFGSGGEEVLSEREIDEGDIAYVVEHVGSFGEDNRAGIERTLHRISAIRNRSGKIVGLTCRVGRAVFGTIAIIEDLVESGRSILIMGRPGVGKTTMLREAARVLADDLDKRVVIVDTSNEIAGDGDIPHPGIGRARRMQVRTPDLQHGVMIEAVENHMPEVIVIDEIGTELEAAAARTIAERGVQLIGTAHGNNLDNLMLNPTLSDLIGGIQTVTLGDDEARRRRTQKSVLERKAPPTFDVVVEIQDRDRVAVHADVAETVDDLLRGDQAAPELRWRDEAGVHRSQARPRPTAGARRSGERFGGLVGGGLGGWSSAVGRSRSLRWADQEVPDPARPGPTLALGATGERRRTSSPGSTTRSRRRAQAGRDPDAPDPASSAAGPAAPFIVGGLADRGPLDRAPAVPEPRARDARELERQAEWRASADRALAASVVRPAPAIAEPDELVDDALDEEGLDETSPADEEETLIRLATDPSAGLLPLEPIAVLGFGISRKRLEQAIRDLQLPVLVVREPDETDVVITLRNLYRQKPPLIREAEARGIPIYVLKSNTVVQMQVCLTNLFVLDTDPRDAAMREVDEAIGLVRTESRPVELSPQNAFVRRLQHQAAEAANLVSKSRGREPFRRVRVYPERVRAWR